jgi:transposase
MSALAQLVDGVIGVDAHRDTLAAAALSPVGGVLAQAAAGADPTGYQALLGFARAHVLGRRCWAVEGTGSYGAGLAVFLRATASSWSRPPGPGGRRGAAAPRPTRSTPPVTCSASSRTSWPGPAGGATARRCGSCWRPGTPPWPPGPPRSTSSRRCWSLRPMTRAPGCGPCRPSGRSPPAPRCGTGPASRWSIARPYGRCTARRVQALQAEADELGAQLEQLAGAVTPWLLELFGVGPVSAAQLLASWSHAGRFRSEAAFAAWPGPARSLPAPARSPRRVRKCVHAARRWYSWISPPSRSHRCTLLGWLSRTTF